MPCIALQDSWIKLNGLALCVVVDRGHIACAAAFGDDITRAGFAPTTLGGDTQFKLDFIEAQACVRMSRNFAIRDSVAYTNNHGD